MDKQGGRYSVKGGFNQQGRLIPALLPDSIAIDERTTENFIEYMVKLSEQFNYYDTNNNINGDWDEFFVSDPGILHSIVANLDVNHFLSSYEIISNEVVLSIEEEEQSKKIAAVFEILIHFTGNIQKINQAVKSQPVQDFFTITFYRVIEEFKFTENIQKIVTLAEVYKIVYKDKTIKIPTHLIEAFPPAETARFETELYGKDSIDKTLTLYQWLNEIFLSFRSIISILMSNATYQLKVKAAEKKVKPHLALIYVFLELYKYLQTEINQIPAKHLAFYFKDLLDMEIKKALPDRAFLLVKPSANAPSQFLLEAGKLFSAESANGEQKYQYALEKETIIANTAIAKLHTIFVENFYHPDNTLKESILYAASPNLVSADEVIIKKQIPQSWPLVGEPQGGFTKSRRNMEAAVLGFLLASPLLYQASGEKYFNCYFYFNSTEKMHSSVLSDILFISVTTKQGWLDIEKKTITIERVDTNSNEQKLVISFKLNEAEQAGLYNEQIHALGLNESKPVLRFQINPLANQNGYSILKNIIVSRVKITASIENAAISAMRNSSGNIDPALPFQVFGPVPVIGNYIELIGSNIFNKFIIKSAIRIYWLNLPKDNLGFKEYYQSYKEEFKNDSFKIAVYGLPDNKQSNEKETVNLFKAQGNFHTDGPLDNHIDINIEYREKIRFENPMLLEQDQQMNETNKSQGVLRLELIEPEYAFGNNSYMQVFSETVLFNAKKSEKKRKALPNTPYLPVAKKIEIDYILEQSESMHQADDTAEDDNGLGLYHLYPFGYKKIYPSHDKGIQPLVPQFDKTGNLFIGLKGAMPLMKITIFFEMDAANYQKITEAEKVYEWSYLNNNQWKDFEKENLLRNDTSNFLKEGVVVLELPPVIDESNTILPAGFFWIRLSLTKNAISIPKVFRVLSNVVEVVRQDFTDTNTLTFLPAGSINDVSIKDPRIETVCQFNASYGGKPAETEMQYYRRSSEMLKHKNRAISAQDIANIVLQNFPDIIFVKCITPFENEMQEENEAYDLKLLVVPTRNWSKEKINYQPCLNILSLLEVKDFIQQFIPAHLKVLVINPVYEKVKVVCKIILNELKEKETEGYFQQKLNEAIQTFISPWLFKDAESSLQKDTIYAIDILNFIKEQPYVGEVTAFSLLHIYMEDVIREQDAIKLVKNNYAVVTDSAIEEMKFIKTSRPDAVLITSRFHFIEFDTQQQKKKSEQPATKLTVKEEENGPEPSGIGRLMIGEDLYIKAKKTIAREEKEINNKYFQLYNLTLK